MNNCTICGQQSESDGQLQCSCNSPFPTDYFHPAVISSDGIHCGDCLNLKSYGNEYALTAKCELTGKQLLWHDYWLAECQLSN